MNNENWLLKLTKVYDHPSVVLWRAIELRHLNNFFKKIKKMPHPSLDLGCGEGGIVKTLFGKGIIDVGLDNGKEMVKKAKRLKVYKEVVLGDAQNLPFKNNYFNLVFSNSVVEHIPDIDKVLEGVSRILKKNGLFVFTVPSDKYGQYLFFSQFFKKRKMFFLGKAYALFRNRQLHHFHCYSLKLWEKKMAKYGLSLVEWQSYISPETLSFWDLMAFKKKFFPSIKMPLAKMNFYYGKDSLSKKGGAFLLAAKKI